MDKAKLTKVTWQEIRAKVAKVNLPLANAIDHLDPSDDFTLYKVSYPFGSNILENGVLSIPLPDGKIVPIQIHKSVLRLKMIFSMLEEDFLQVLY